MKCMCGDTCVGCVRCVRCVRCVGCVQCVRLKFVRCACVRVVRRVTRVVSQERDIATGGMIHSSPLSSLFSFYLLSTHPSLISSVASLPSHLLPLPSSLTPHHLLNLNRMEDIHHPSII